MGDIVKFDSGVLKSNSSMSCFEACDGKCCEGGLGTDACDGFTGLVCKKIITVNGEGACKKAEVDLVVVGCCGDFACSSILKYNPNKYYTRWISKQR